jgi:predicted DNA-binding transcriptional regulator AlpA
LTLEKLIKDICFAPLLTRKDMARRYGRSLETIDEWRRKRWIPKPVYIGRIPHWRLGDVYLFEQNERMKK